MRLVSVTDGPGLVGALLTGISFAKSISYSLKVPLIGVNHVLAHLYSALLNDEGERPDFPFVGLVVSGGHTALFHCADIGKETLLGQTQDDAVGEAYDKVAKILGLGYPGGPVIEKMAKLSKGGSLRFPKTYLGADSLDFSFSGIKTAVLYHVKAAERRLSRKLDKREICDICFAFQEAVQDVLVDKIFLAAGLKKVNNIVIGGGVAINARLREKFREAAGLVKGMNIYFPRMEYCLDNAAMVGALGEELFRRGRRSDLYLSAEPNLKA
jgi:N6-L-threonylcarbamoyladenine synthase